MYEDSWYSYVPESYSKKHESSHPSKHRRRESLLKQPNGSNQIPEPSDPLMELYEGDLEVNGPPKATLARRAKSYSNFYDAAIGYLGKEVGRENPKDPLDLLENAEDIISFGDRYENFENDLLDTSHEEYQLYRDQLALSERHLDNLLHDTSSALDLLAILSGSFKAVESQTTAFQAQCEDLLAEQKRLRDLADEVGTDLQYYGYLEPLTRRLNAPGAGRLVRSDDFLDMLTNLNTCIDFMDQHPQYRDSTVYKTRYISLLERSLNIIQIVFSSALREISEDVSKQLKLKDQNETAQYILLYGRFESIMEMLGPQVERLLTSGEFAFGWKGDSRHRRAYVQQYHELYKQITEAYLKSRDPVGPLVLKNLRQFATSEPKPETDFELFARRCVQHVFDVCHNELKLIESFFNGGPLLVEYPGTESWNVYSNYAEKLEQNRLSHIKTLHGFLTPYLSNGDLHRVCDLVNWLETMYLAPSESDEERDSTQDAHKSAAQTLLNDHLWPLSDSLFIKAASELEHFKPSPEDLKIGDSSSREPNKANDDQKLEPKVQINNDGQTPEAPVSTAYPTVKAAVALLVMYNDSMYDRPKGEVLYEIVHQATESLQRAATTIKRTSTILDAQVFLIKNLMLIENLFMTHEIPDSIRQSAELDFSPIWETIRELQARKQLFNPLAYINPLVQGQLLPAVVDHLLDARKELEKVLVQQITAFTKYWQSRLTEKGQRRDTVLKANKELEALLNRAFDETTKAGLWKMIRADES